MSLEPNSRARASAKPISPLIVFDRSATTTAQHLGATLSLDIIEVKEAAEGALEQTDVVVLADLRPTLPWWRGTEVAPTPPRHVSETTSVKTGGFRGLPRWRTMCRVLPFRRSPGTKFEFGK